MKDEFEIRAMGFGELAQCYNPKSTASSARNTLRTWINRNPSLMKELSLSGYKKGYHTLSPKQVSIIVHHLGPP